MRKITVFTIFTITVLLLTSLMTPLSVYAGVSLDTGGLTEAQKAQLVIEIEKMKSEAKKVEAPSVPVVQKAEEWVELGEKIARVMITVAKQLGVAADELLNSTTGKITMVIVVWKLIGQDLLGVAVGISFLVVFILMWAYYFRRLCVIKGVIEKTPEKGFRRVREYQYHDYKDGTIQGIRFLMFIILVIIVATGLIITL